MAKILFTKQQIADRHLDIARNYKTIYMYACYGWPVRRDTIARKAAQNLNGWYTPDRIAALQAVADRKPPVWGFDCVNLTKGILWGWRGDETLPYGGAVHASNGVPDTNANGMIQRCYDVSSDFSHIEVGEGLWLNGHWGLYVGNGLAVECTGRWDNGVQITSVWNLGKKAGFNGRYWTKHGKLPWVDYDGKADSIEPEKITLGSRVIKKGTQGSDVKELQEDLMKLGYDLPKYGADGECGKETVNAIKLFQDDHDLEADGEAGRDTIAAIRKALDSQTAPANPAKRWPDAEVVCE